MAIEGKVRTLYTDKTMSEAILPRTNTKAITDDKGVNLNAILDQVAYISIRDSESTTVPLNADTLGGRLPDEYALESELTEQINIVNGKIPTTAAQVGAAPDTHTHAAGDITSGVLSIARGGTGYTSIMDTTYTTARYRASSLHSTETNPTSNGVIAWTYE